MMLAEALTRAAAGRRWVVLRSVHDKSHRDHRRSPRDGMYLDVHQQSSHDCASMARWSGKHHRGRAPRTHQGTRLGCLRGARPGTAGEARTIEYLVQQFRSAGLRPGNPDGRWTQPVPTTGFISTATFAVRAGSAVREMVRGKEFAVRSRQLQPIVTVGESEMVFLGYGIHAPQYGWDDYKEVDVRGKTLVMLEGEPPASAVENAPPARLFRQAKASFWGTKSSKLDAAARKGAAAVLFIHEAEKKPDELSSRC